MAGCGRWRGQIESCGSLRHRSPLWDSTADRLTRVLPEFTNVRGHETACDHATFGVARSASKHRAGSPIRLLPPMWHAASGELAHQLRFAGQGWRRRRRLVEVASNQPWHPHRPGRSGLIEVEAIHEARWHERCPCSKWGGPTKWTRRHGPIPARVRPLSRHLVSGAWKTSPRTATALPTGPYSPVTYFEHASAGPADRHD